MPEPNTVTRMSYRLFVGSILLLAAMGLVMLWARKDWDALGEVWSRIFFSAAIVAAASGLLLAGWRTLQIGLRRE